MRRPREVIRKLPGGFVVDVEGNESVETAEMVARLIIRIWPEVVNHIAVELEETHGTFSETES